MLTYPHVLTAANYRRLFRAARLFLWVGIEAVCQRITFIRAMKEKGLLSFKDVTENLHGGVERAIQRRAVFDSFLSLPRWSSN